MSFPIASVVGDHYTSFLPESLRIQFNTYLDLCGSAQGDLPDADLALWRGHKVRVLRTIQQTNDWDLLSEELEPFHSEDGATKVPLNFLKSFSSYLCTPQEYSEQQIYHLRINEKLLEALSQGLLLTCDEYQRALQVKHWEQVCFPFFPHSSRCVIMIVSLIGRSREW